MEIKRIGSVQQPGTYLKFAHDRLAVGLTQTDTEFSGARWVLESLEPYGIQNGFRIRHHLKEDHYLHVETGSLVCEPIGFGANSSYWIIESLNTLGTFRLRNYWRTTFHIYRDEATVVAGAVDPESLSTHWHIEDATDNSLLVPIHLDALWLPHDQAVSAPLADFSRLPYFSGQRDVNPNTANISEEILTPAQQLPRFYLKSGLRLHWALPDALHRGVQLPDRLQFLKAPDRWLITKTANGAETQWVVESNYLHPPGDNQLEAVISYPYLDESHPQPFRYLGRKLPLAEWSETDSLGTNPNYLHTLTAVGYGEPTFAAFYPNCHSVFGFYDEESAGKSVLELRGVQYEVIGWHSAAGADVLQDSYFVTRVEALRTGHQATLVTAPYQFETLKSEMGWIVEGAEDTAFPNATVYFARLTLAADAVPDPKDRRPQATIAIGNSATEALSAHLGLEIGGNDKSILEEQLEALHLMPELEGQQLDTGPKFREARHTQGFKAVHGGLISTFKPGSNPSGEANAQSAPNQAQVTLPDDLAFRLSALNTARQRHDRAIADRETLREQLFSDWYKYMVAAYPPEDARDDFPDMDEISYFIKQKSLKELDAIGQEIVSLGSQLQEAEAQFSRAVDNLQRIVVEDIRDWGRLLALLSGRDSPQNELFRTVFERVRNGLPDGLRPLLARDSDQAPPMSSSEKEELVAGINAIIDNNPAGLIAEEVVPQLPAEAQELFAQRDPSLTPSEQRRRLGRLILETALPETLSRRPRYVVDDVPAPRYWQPTEPVVLIADSDLKLTERHGEDGRLRDDNLLACYLLTHARVPGTDTTPSPISDLIDDIRARMDELQTAVVSNENETAAGHIGFYTWQEQPWHPFMLEWTVELFPLKESGSHSAIDRQYQSDFINTHYDFPEESVDLVFKHTRSSLTRSANLYSGRSLMLDYAQPLLVERLQDYCTKHLAPLYYDANDVPPAERRNKPPLEVITAWAQENRERLSPFNQAVLDIQNHLAQSQSPPIAQALSGFNAALLQHKQTLQLPIDDPLGFPDAKALAGEVSEGVGRTNRRAPQPLNDFNPLRTGALRLQHLRLVDTFGRVQTLLDDKTRQPLVPSQPFRKIGNDTVMLPPRLVQPARLNFNWLAANPGAEGGAIMMNAHPATSPVCGWMVPNYLDSSLLVYNQAGEPLGALQSRGDGVAWSSAPGRQHRILEIDVSNEHLYRLVSHFLSQNYNFLDDVLTALESALENIMPASGAEHDSLALLVGRPLAVVRASLDLEIKGRLATNQDWNLFRRTLQTGTRNSDGFAAVSFPLRIGEHSRLNDGLLGFWIENNNTNNPTKPYLDNKLYLPQTPNTPRTGSIDHPDIVMHRGTATPHIQQAIDTPQRTLTMLVDPRGTVHITSGILPLQSLSIPPDQYMPALRNLEMTFFSGPFLTKLDGIELPLPTEPGFTWSALTKENGAWADTHAIDPVEQNATFSAPHMIREGWLKLTRETMNDK